nr:MAG TPA: hypothetical protein [Caudoviricetes sp.]
MKWGMNIFGRRQPKGGVRGKRGAKPEQQNVKMPKKTRRSVDERLREAEFRDAYRTRDNMSTKALKSKIARLEAEQRFKQLVEAPEKARLEALQKKKQARLAFIGKVGSAALDVYSKAPSSIAGRNLSGQAAKDAIEAFKKRQEWAKAFKDVPTTMTKFTQSISVGGVDVYVPESVQNRFMIQHAGRKGMKWGMNIFGKRDRYARNNFSKEHYQTYKYVRERVKKGKSEYKLSKKIHRLTKDLYDSQPTEQNRLLTNVAYDARKDAKTTRKKYKGSVKKIFNKYSETDFDLKGGLAQSGVNMGETINGVYIPSTEDILQHYGKKGMKWKKKKAMTPEEEIDQNDAAYHSAKKEIDRLETMLSKYKKGKGKISSVKSVQDQIDKFKESVRTYQDKDDEIRTRTGSKYQSKSPMYSETVDKKTGTKFRKYNRNFKHSGASEDILLHYGKKGMKWKKKGEGAQGVGMAGLAPAMQSAPHSQDFNKNTERLSKLYESMTGPTSGKYAEKTKKKRAKIQKEIDELQKKNKKLNAKSEKALSFYNKPTKHSDTSEDTLLHYGKKGMKWRKNGEGATPGMSPAEMAIAEARAKQDSKSYNYNLKMREEAIKNAIKRGASGKEIRRLQALQKDDQRKVDMNNRHKEALKKKDRNRSSYSRTVEEVDASNGNKPKFKKYKY